MRLPRAMLAGLFIGYSPDTAGLAAEPFKIDLPGVERCLEARFDADHPPETCLKDAQAPCRKAAVDGPAVATLCYARARDSWSEGIAATLGGLDHDEATDRLRIEVRYDLLGRLLQCDRNDELARLATAPPEDILQRDKARCHASVTAIVYAKLRWQLRNIK